MKCCRLQLVNAERFTLFLFLYIFYVICSLSPIKRPAVAHSEVTLVAKFYIFCDIGLPFLLTLFRKKKKERANTANGTPDARQVLYVQHHISSSPLVKKPACELGCKENT